MKYSSTDQWSSHWMTCKPQIPKSEIVSLGLPGPRLGKWSDVWETIKMSKEKLFFLNVYHYSLFYSVMHLENLKPVWWRTVAPGLHLKKPLVSQQAAPLVPVVPGPTVAHKIMKYHLVIQHVVPMRNCCGNGSLNLQRIAKEHQIQSPKQ